MVLAANVKTVQAAVWLDATMATVTSKATDAKDEGSESVTKVIRVTLTAEQWRRLRIKAAEKDESMTRLLGAILAHEADKGGDA